MLTKKAKNFLNTLTKARDGLQFPYIEGEANDLVMDTTPIMFNGVNVNPAKSPQTDSEQSSSSGLQSVGKSLSSGSNIISSGIQMGMAINSLIQGAKAKKAYKNQKRIYDQEYKKKMEETRANDFYYTPYTVGRSDDYVMQQGGEIEDFMQYYMNQKQGNQGILNTIKESYDQENNLAKQKYQTLQQEGYQGFGNVLKGQLDNAQKILTMGLAQDGGELPESEEPNLYSPNFNIEFPEDPEEQEAMMSDVRHEQEYTDLLTNWIFEETSEEKPSSMYEGFRKVMSPDLSSFENNTVQQTMNDIGRQESGGDYGIVNRSGGSKALNATGKYQFVPKFWAKSIAQFMGKPNMGESETMEMFRKSPETQEAFMQHVITDIYMPEVEKLRPLARRYNLSDSEIIKLLHYRGIADTRERLRTGNLTEISESEKRLYNNPSPLEYIKRK